ncbi:MAG: hypothetical protein QW687_01565 [Candidatus Hadarchaeales archaeon]
MVVLACRRCLWEGTCTDPNEPNFHRRIRCILGQLDWGLEEKLEEMSRLGKWFVVPTNTDVEKIHQLCLQERERRGV